MYASSTFNGAFGATTLWTGLQGFAGQLTVPIGAWKIGYQITAGLTSTVTGARNGLFLLAPSTPTPGATAVSATLTSRLYNPSALATAIAIVRSEELVLTSATIYVPWFWIYAASGAETFSMNGAEGGSDIYAEPSYL
jgi:expansin (peptidoglycan-binding protein)